VCPPVGSWHYRLPTQAGAEAVLKQLNAGADFSVLAKEKSTDATAVDGGYLGKMDPKGLRLELQEALNGRTVGQLTGVVHLPSGFAILKVLEHAPALEDLNPDRMKSLISTGVISSARRSADMPKPSPRCGTIPSRKAGPGTCARFARSRTGTAQNAKVAIRDALKSVLGAQTTTEEQVDADPGRIRSCAALCIQR
jgi:hypothetical protein